MKLPVQKKKRANSSLAVKLQASQEEFCSTALAGLQVMILIKKTRPFFSYVGKSTWLIKIMVTYAPLHYG
jgi:hypothetical protein